MSGVAFIGHKLRLSAYHLHRLIDSLVNGHTLDIVLKDLSEDGEECFLEAADSGGVGLAGDPDRQAQRLKQVVVKVRLAGILKTCDRFWISRLPLNKPAFW